jgi:hypothetical protein
MSEETLPGGNTHGAVRIGGVVHKRASPWTPTVHALLRHLEYAGVDGVPRALGFDDQGRQILTYLPGEVIGDRIPWPAWVYADSTLVQVGQWMRRIHDALVGFFDWDIASPSPRDDDLAFSALLWVPLTEPDAGEQSDSDDVRDRSRRLHLLLDAYRYDGDRRAFGAVIVERARRQASSAAWPRPAIGPRSPCCLSRAASSSPRRTSRRCRATSGRLSTGSARGARVLPRALVLAQNGFLDFAFPAGCEGVLGSDDLETRFLEDPERADVVAGRAGVQRPGGD